MIYQQWLRQKSIHYHSKQIANSKKNDLCHWGILSVSKAFDHFRARRDEIRFTFDPT